MNISDVIKLKESIEKAQLEKANLEGQLESIYKELKEKYGIDDPNTIENYIGELGAQIFKMETELNSKMKELEDELNRNEKQNQ
jgi:chaperonin cofactor prefoldin